jgi:uncharacterized membrane protein (UPF0182 family)
VPGDPDKSNRRPRRRRSDGVAGDGLPRRAGRGRSVLLTALVILVVLLVSLRGIAAFYTDKLWFESLGLGTVWSTALGTRISLALLGAGVFFGLCWANMVIAERLAPVFRPVAPADDLIERYHDLVGHRAALVRLGLAVFLSVLFGASLGASWTEWLLFRNRVDFGQTDATFGVDIGFYVFQLPFITAALSWLFSVLVVVLFTTLLVHIVNGGIRFHSQMERTTPQVKAHLSVLLGVLALVQAVRYWVGRYELTFSTRGTVDGATYTDVNVELRATYLLVLIALFAFGLFIANIWRRGWTLPVLAVGLWMLVAVLAGGIVPAFVQRFRVEPSESSMEAPYIRHNIEATRAAYGLDVETETFEWDGTLDAAAMEREVETLQNVRLWDPAIIEASFGRQQQLKGFYEINDVDVDRYVIDGQVTPVMISARDLDTAGVQQSSWEATHLAFTHGYGVVAAKANDRTASGDPDLVVSGIPVTTTGGMPEVEDPGIYFGEDKTGYVIVDTDRKEIDYQNAENQSVTTTYQGADGVRLGSGLSGFVRRSAFALRFGDINPLVSGNIRPESRMLIERDISGRLQAVAPFLAYDHDPYVVVTGGSVKYVVDAYTTSSNFPNAQRADTGGLGADSGLRGRSFNYVRNSVKAVVDAYDGTVTLYVVDEQDPILRAYRKAFPDLFTDGDEVPDDLRAHFRYPEDLFTVQTQMWSKYHVSDADSFYNGNSEWAIPPEPGGKTVSGDQTTAVGADGQPITSGSRYESKYQMLKLPGDEGASFVLLRPYVGASRGAGSQNLLTAFMVASSDPESYGRLRSFVMPGGKLPDGPITAADDIQADEAVAALRRTLCQGQSTCGLATPSIVPIGNSILYVQSFFVSGTELGAPKLQQVIVSFQSATETRVEVDETLRGALVKLFGDDVPTAIESTPLSDPVVVDPDDGTTDPADPADPDDPSDPSGGSTTTTTTRPDGPALSVAEQQAALIAQLEAAFDAADAAAREGDMVGYSEQVQRARDIAAQLAALQAGPTTTAPATTTTTTAGA